MHRPALILLSLHLFFLQSALSQGEANIWYFGRYAGMDFNSGSPVAIRNSSMFTNEGCATINDKNGQLLFYTDGITVWNRLHQVMVNGTGLLGHFSSSQSAIVVPKPLTPNIYYVFTVDAMENASNGFNYSIVDMTLQSGLGEVIQKNIPLIQDTCLEKITAIKNCNGKDVWVIVHPWRGNQFKSFLVTSAGISTSPVISNVGTPANIDFTNAAGCMKASPDGKKLAAAYERYFTMDFVEVYDFNAQTGIISNPVFIQGTSPPGGIGDDEGQYGVEFSPNNKLLYVSAKYRVHPDSVIKSFLYQFDLSN